MIRLAFIITLGWIAAAVFVVYNVITANIRLNGNQVLVILGIASAAVIGYAAIDQRERHRKVQELRLRLKPRDGMD